MKKSLKTRLILTYAAVALVTVLVALLFVRFRSGQSLRNLVIDQQVEEMSVMVEEYYTTNQSLDGFVYYYLSTMLRSGGDSPFFQPPRDSDPEDIRGIRGLVDTDGKTLLPTQNLPVGVVVPERWLDGAREVEVDGVAVAWILIDEKSLELSRSEQMFMGQVNLAIAIAAGAGILTAVITGVLLAAGILKPIRKLTEASEQMAQGALGQQVDVSSKDEIGRLSESFNRMSIDLARADAERKRLTADITHDLSTPLQIVSGYIEMYENGDVSLNPQQLGIIKAELENLKRLVGDLTVLTQAEGGGVEILLSPVAPNQLLEQIAEAFQPLANQQGVELRLDLDQTPVMINADDGRMLQVFKNLMENALRHTPNDGTVTLASKVGERVELSVADTGDGIAAEDLPLIFERFYQADKARTGSKGKMGLGLAICKALVELQGASIRAESAGIGQGTKIIVTIQKI
ncbi:MAG TPA: ATP-binding protein [Anaerolineaceae bacterium]|nr:ATP-binding protein [Anaerolineaceae bacterium]